MASSAKRDPNGTWRIQYRYTDWTGKKRKSQKRGFKTKKEAEEWVAHFKYQQSSDPSMPLRDFWKIYMEDMGKRLKETTMVLINDGSTILIASYNSCSLMSLNSSNISINFG